MKAYCKEIRELPTIASANPRKASEFSDMFSIVFTVNRVVAMTLDKLSVIQEGIARLIQTEKVVISRNFLK